MRPTIKSSIALAVAAVALFFLSASGHPGSYWENGPVWLGDIGWYGMLICVLLLIVSGVMALVAKLRGGEAAA